jgi:hypothetical protein
VAGDGLASASETCVKGKLLIALSSAMAKAVPQERSFSNLTQFQIQAV